MGHGTPYSQARNQPARAARLEPSEPAPSTINEKTIADFTRVVEQTGILNPGATRPEPRDGD